uniref:TPX2 C-terminal domain-containing protein n=1 Tax=Kalanchoe fedtschenkoi TaxID=63787 RepID=A0A7N0V6I6_KALFE
MESENGLTLEEKTVSNDKDATNVNVTLEVPEPEDGLRTSVKLEATLDADGHGTEIVVNPSMEPSPGNDAVKVGKVAKGLLAPKGAKKQRPGLSQSLSFPARGGHDLMKKSVEGYPVKTEIRKSQSKASDGTSVPAAAAPRLYNPTRRASTGTNSKQSNAIVSKPSSRRPKLPAPENDPEAESDKSGAAKESSTISTANVKQSADRGSLALKKLKDEDDTHSTTSSLTPRGSRRSSGSKFSFRLDERAEKRKEFFLKLEEKIHAKEMERNNIQEKTKETCEAEIKQLRKSLTFKAAPMPAFYKEPPPKVELKKIPTTRPISPKLGRGKSKGVADAANTSVASVVPSQSQELNNSSKESQGRTLRKSVSKLQPSVTTVTKSAKKPTKTKESEIQKVPPTENNESENGVTNPPEVEKKCIEIESEDIVNGGVMVPISAKPDDITPSGMGIGG